MTFDTLGHLGKTLEPFDEGFVDGLLVGLGGRDEPTQFRHRQEEDGHTADLNDFGIILEHFTYARRHPL